MTQRLSSVDTAWYRLDAPNDPADILGVLIFDGPIDYKRLVATIEARFLRFRRFSQRVVEPVVGRPRWQDDPDFSLANHLERVELAEPADTEALQGLIGELMNRELDKSRPLWRLYLVDNYERGSAVIAQLHHCLGDGFALAHVLLSMADTDPDAPWPSWSDADRVDSQAEDGERHRWVGEVVFDEVEETLKHPSRLLGMAKQVTKSATTLGRLLGMSYDPQTLLKRQPAGKRCVSWSRGIALERVKQMAHAADGTVNDILMAALAGAWRRYLLERGEAADEFDIRSLVPVNLRPIKRVEDMPDTLGNHFGLVFLDLPVSQPDALGRLRRLQASMGALKQSPQAYLLFQVFNLAGHIPESIEHLIADTFGKKASTVVTNVPGPKEPLYLAGQRMTELMFWAPHPAQLGTNASIISYAGTVRVGLRSDQNVLDDPQTVVGYFDEEFGFLERAIRQI